MQRRDDPNVAQLTNAPPDANQDALQRKLAIRVVILNYRTPALVIDALRSIDQDPDCPTGMKVVVVDNDSGDGSAEQIQRTITSEAWSDWCHVLPAGKNGGFSAGNNVGIESADADAYLLLNSDTLVRPGAIATLADELARRPDAGLISPRLEWPDGTPQISCFRFFRPLTELLKSAATGPITRRFRHADVPWPTVPDGGHAPCEPDWTSFACVMVRRDVFDAVGLMDDGYFMYFDDVDYCRRAKSMGFHTVHCPDARVVHLRGGSSPVKSLHAQRKRRPRYYYAARARYYAKHFGRFGLLRANLFWTAGRMISWGRERIGGRDSHVCQQEWRDIWTNFFRPTSGPSR